MPLLDRQSGGPTHFASHSLPLPEPLRRFLDSRAASAGTFVQVPEHVDLIRQGDRPDNIHLLLTGWACRYFHLEDGRRQIPAVLLPGDLADLDRLASDRAEFGLSTLTPCKFACLPVGVVWAALEHDPGLAQAVLLMAVRNTTVLSRRTVSLARRSAYERLANFLCEIVTRLADGGAPAEGAFSLPLTQAVLGDVLGLSTVHVNRVLQKLRKDGLIRARSRRIEILDWPGLAAAGEFHDGRLVNGQHHHFARRAEKLGPSDSPAVTGC